MVARPLALLVLAACSGKPRAEDAAHGAVVRGDGGPAVDGAAGDGALGGGAAADAGGDGGLATGDLQIRIEWPDVPVGARSSPGRTPCNTPRAAAVAPTTTWGVPGVLVVVAGSAPPLGEVRVTLADCALSPRLSVAGALVIASAVDHPASVVLRERGPLERQVAGVAVPVLLPISGHAVATALTPGAIYSLETAGLDPELAYVAALPGAQVTEASGQVTVRALAAGSHAVTAWLPPRAGQPARTGHATATVVAGDLAELTITLAP